METDKPYRDQLNEFKENNVSDVNPLEQALELTTGARQHSYGHPADNFANIAAGWSAIFNRTVTPEQVSLCMIWLKICRELHKPDLDNLVDMAGYVNTLHMIKTRQPDVKVEDKLLMVKAHKSPGENK